ncbi:hypothetical protein ACFXO9_26985 [Nocardia tengchongensis]|uniref:hypothetical protein n=1 Tax=Nocardia tengchongensis TaxID=2055889 RepID=UPI00368BF9D2
MNTTGVLGRELECAHELVAGQRIEIAASPSQTILGFTTGSQHHTLRTLDMLYAPCQGYLKDSRTADLPAQHCGVGRSDQASVATIAARRTSSADLHRGHDSPVRWGDNEGNAEETIACEFDREPLTITFNPRYLLEGLTATHAESVEIALNGPIRAATLRTAHHKPDEQRRDGLTYVLMPVRPPG